MTYPDYSTLAQFGAAPGWNLDTLNQPNNIMNPMLNTGVPGGSAGGNTDWLSWDRFLGTPEDPGWGSMALGTAQGLFGGYLGLQQLGMAKKAFGENQRQFNMNFDAQRRTTNAALADRQRARLASNPGAYQSEDAYMAQYGVK